MTSLCEINDFILLPPWRARKLENPDINNKQYKIIQFANQAVSEFWGNTSLLCRNE